MKIFELEIEHVRGIKGKISLKPNGENVAVHGPNGSGKSGVVDALDFLMTGDISRLTGKGTKGITLKDYGKHIDSKPEDAVVTAKVLIEGISDPITLQRKMSDPKNLIVDPDVNEQLLQEALEIAQRGQHVLSRAEILKYITAESGARSGEIQAVLNLQAVEDLRKTFVTIKREADKNVQSERTNVERSKAAIKPIIAIEDFSDTEVLKKVNENRSVLDGNPLDRLEPNFLHNSVNPVPDSKIKTVNPETLKRTIRQAERIIAEKATDIYEKDKELKHVLQNLKADKMLEKDLSNKRLIDLGISLIDETGECPLCLKLWKPQELKAFLQQRQSRAGEATEIETKIKYLSSEIDKNISTLYECLRRIQSSCEQLGEKEIVKTLEPWTRSMADCSQNLKNVLEYYPPVQPVLEEIKKLSAPEKREQLFKPIMTAAIKIKDFTPEQQAWNILTELRPTLQRYLDDEKRLKEAERYAKKAGILGLAYTQTKDKVLQDLYDSVNQDFSTYYKDLHGEDEKHFVSELKPDGPHLDFKVDFYGRGSHNPRALHSEGHQDSMGLCLYLALNKKISENKVKLVILDDVVMSIDSNHRRSICRLLKQHFPDTQFVITTHNKTWARQLNTDGVVKKSNSFHFKGWSIDAGPSYGEDGDVWQNIQVKLQDDEISSAAHLLREHCEFFYENVCNSLKGKVEYRSDGRWEFGDYLNAAKSSYKGYLKKAKKSANSWNKKDDVKEYEQKETQAKEIFERIQMEHWGINENVHYNKWKDFTKEDFLPVAEVFQDLENLFRCPECQGIIGVNTVGKTLTNIKCPCGNITWNLETKK